MGNANEAPEARRPQPKLEAETKREKHRTDAAAPHGERRGRRPIKAPAHTDHDRNRQAPREPIAAPLRGGRRGRRPLRRRDHRPTDAPTHKQSPAGTRC